MAVRLASRSDAAADIDRRAVAIARWKRRSHLVHFFRRALPTMIVLIVLAVIGWILAEAILGRLNAGDASVGTIHLTHPKYYGRNSQGEPFVVSADQAVRDPAAPDLVTLTHPAMQMANGGPQPLKVRADHGLYNERDHVLDLTGRVQLDDGKGYHFASETARIDTKTNVVTGNTAVTGEGPLGHVSAASYAIYDKGDRVVFIGNVKTHLVNGDRR